MDTVFDVLVWAISKTSGHSGHQQPERTQMALQSQCALAAKALLARSKVVKVPVVELVSLTGIVGRIWQFVQYHGQCQATIHSFLQVISFEKFQGGHDGLL
jgi:hypothetical protein